jgi:thiamine-phosphate diphosphorylase
MTPVIPGPILLLTDRTLTRGRSLVDVVRRAVDGGARAVVLREKDLPRRERMTLAAELRAFVPFLIVASDPEIPSDGIHLAGEDAFPSACAAARLVVGRSCHSEADLEVACAQGCDYATLSPIHASPSKPGYGPPLGVAALRAAPLPVYALGGVDATNARECLAAGAAGVAVMGAVMRSEDPASAVAELLS